MWAVNETARPVMEDRATSYRAWTRVSEGAAESAPSLGPVSAGASPAGAFAAKMLTKLRMRIEPR